MRRAVTLLLLILLPLSSVARADEPLRIFAAASLGDAVAAIGDVWREKTDQELRTSLAGTATLARQIAAGAPADVFLSANADWMVWAQDQGVIAKDAAQVFASNALVMIAPANRAAPVELTPNALRTRLGSGRLAMGLPDAVPAGTYGRAALRSLGLWFNLETSIAGTDSVRAALALVALGAAPLGIVYATDMRAEPRVAKVADIPGDSHPPITYHAAWVTDTQAARDFVAFLMSDAAQVELAKLGFGPVQE